MEPLSNEEIESAAYRACLVGAVGAGVASGLTVGRWVGLKGVLAGAGAGALWGLVLGLRSCPQLAPRIREKLDSGLAMQDSEVQQALRTIQAVASVRSAADAVFLLSIVRATAPAAPRQSTPQVLPMAAAASRLLALRG